MNVLFNIIYLCFFFRMFFPRRVHRNTWMHRILKRCYSHNVDNMSKIRNIGILAHIDAGNYSFVYYLICYFTFYALIT